MYLSTRKVRSAGRTSGSIEITLPADLQFLEGIDCRLMVRDGPRPEIVLQPDVSSAQVLFHELWEKLRLGLGELGEIGDFSPADFTLGLFPPGHWQERPPLSYADALIILRDRKSRTDRSLEALSGMLASLGIVAGYRLELEGILAQAFGDALAYLVTGISAGLGTDFERGMAHRIFWGERHAKQFLGSLFDDRAWLEARSGLRRVFDHFQDWQEDPEVYASAREKWYRALTVEMGMSVSSMDRF